MSRTALKIFKPRNIFSLADIVLLFIFLAFLTGYIIGVVLINNDSESIKSLATNSFSNIIEYKGEFSFFALFLKSLFDLLPYVVLAYIFGTTMFGCALIPALCVIRGAFSGILIAFIYNKYAINGLGFVALIIAPICIFSAFILILASRESLFYSQRLLKNAFPNTSSQHNFSLDFKLYSIRYLIILLFMLISALLDATLTSVFFKFFSFS